MRHTTYDFAEPIGFRPLELDVWLPGSGPSPEPVIETGTGTGTGTGTLSGGRLPVVIWIHGGAWMSGTRKHPPETYPDMFAQVCAAGFAVVSLDYRLSAEARFPAQYDDVLAGFDWVLERAESFGIDAGRVAVWGESAGGHLASMLALRIRPSDRIRCAVPFYAPADFRTFGEQTAVLPVESIAADDPGNPVTLLLGGSVTGLAGAARDASPITYAHAGAPPMMLLHGTEDMTVPYAQSEQLAKRLTELGAPVRLEPVPGADHIFRGHPDPTQVIARAIEFTAEYTRA